MREIAREISFVAPSTSPVIPPKWRLDTVIITKAVIIAPITTGTPPNLNDRNEITRIITQESPRRKARLWCIASTKMLFMPLCADLPIAAARTIENAAADSDTMRPGIIKDGGKAAMENAAVPRMIRPKEKPPAPVVRSQ